MKHSLLCYLSNFWRGGVILWFYIWVLNASYVSIGVILYALPCVLQPVTKAWLEIGHIKLVCTYTHRMYFGRGFHCFFLVRDLKESQTGIVKNIPFPWFPLSRVVSLHLFLLPIYTKKFSDFNLPVALLWYWKGDIKQIIFIRSSLAWPSLLLRQATSNNSEMSLQG